MKLSLGKFCIPALAIVMICNRAHADEMQANTENRDTPPPSLLTSSEKLLESYVLGRKVNLGAGFAQGTFKLWRTGEKAQLTDNGGVSLIASVDSRTRPLKTWPMRHGEASLGYDFTATGSFFSPSKQLLNSATQGEDIGTSVNGGFVAAAPRLTVYMGPLYEGGHIFWKYSAGAGAALMHFNGNALFEGDQSTGLHSVGGSVVPSLYIETKWQMQFGHWDVIFNSQYLGTHSKGYFTTYEVYGVGAAYQFSF